MTDEKNGSADPKVVLITGGAKGIGLATAQAFTDMGWNVVICGRDRAALQSAAESLRRRTSNASVIAMEMDVTDSQSIDNIFQQVRNRLGPVSVLVNNAGIIARGPAKDLSEDEWRRVLETDLTGVFLCSKAAFSHMSNLGGGSIINVGSIAGFVGLAGRLAYTTAKAGLSGFTRTLALEWAKDGIRVNTVAPGWTRTEMVVKGLQAGLLDENVLAERIPQKRLADPSEIASAVRFFASPESSYVTGQTLIVDGGFTINGH